MSSFTSRLAAAFGLLSIDDVLSPERLQVAQLELTLSEKKQHAFEARVKNEQAIAASEESVKSLQKEFHDTLQPLHERTDALIPGEISYDHSVHLLESEARTMEAVLQRDHEQYGFIGKKLVSLGLNFESLKRKLLSGEPFEKELKATLEDTHSDVWKSVAAPLQRFASEGIPSHALARAEAFLIFQLLEEAGRKPQRKHTRWLDFFRLSVPESDTSGDERRAKAHQLAEDIMQSVKEKEYAAALESVHESKFFLQKWNESLLDRFAVNEASFRKTVVPLMASRSFLMYGSAALTCGRFANVEMIISPKSRT